MSARVSPMTHVSSSLINPCYRGSVLYSIATRYRWQQNKYKYICYSQIYLLSYTQWSIYIYMVYILIIYIYAFLYFTSPGNTSFWGYYLTQPIFSPPFLSPFPPSIFINSCLSAPIVVFLSPIFTLSGASGFSCRFSVVVVGWQQDKNGKRASEKTEAKSGRVHRGR